MMEMHGAGFDAQFEALLREKNACIQIPCTSRGPMEIRMGEFAFPCQNQNSHSRTRFIGANAP